MADPLLLAAYAAGKWIEKKNRDAAAAALAAKEKAEKEAEAMAETRVIQYGRFKPDGPVVQLSPMMADYDKAEIVYEKLGKGEIKRVDPKARTEPIFVSSDGQVGNKKFFEQNIVKSFGKFGTIDDFGLKVVGNRTYKGGTYEDKWMPDPILKGPDKPKDVVVAQGTIIGKDGQPQIVYAPNVAALETKYPDAKRPGQVKVSPDFAAGLGFSAAELSTDLKSFATAPPKEPAVEEMRYVGEMEDGRIIYADTAVELRDQGAVRIGESKFNIKDGKKTRAGNISWLDKTEDEKKETKQFATVYELNDDGERVDDKQIDIPLWKYRENTSKYEVVTGYQKDETGQRSSIDIGSKSAGELKGALNIAESFFDIKHKDAKGKENHFVIGTEGGSSPAVQLGKFRNWVETLPRKNGNIDWTSSGLDTADKMRKIRNYATNVIEQNAAIKDPITNQMVPSRDLLVDTIQYMEIKYPSLTQIPGLELSVQVRAGIASEAAVKELKALNSRAPDGSAQNVVVAQTAVELPANMVDPNASPNEQPIPAKLNLAIPFDPKYNETVDFVMSALAPSGSEAEISAARNSFKSLVNFEYDEQGRVKKGPRGQSIISKVQPKLDFLTYLTKTKDIDDTPFFATWQNMLKIGAQRDISNPAIENDIKIAFNSAFDGSFEDGMAVVSAFSPSAVGNMLDRTLWAAQNNKDSREFAKERISRTTQADAAATAVVQIDRMVQTYYTKDGQFIDINTTLGQFYVSADGAVHLFRQGMENILPGLIPVNQEQAVTAAQNTIFGKDRNGRPNFISIVDNQLPAADMLALAKEKGYATVDKFLEAERSARAENVAAFQKSVAGLGSNDEKVKNLALRNYYRFMVAYTMASAIQGGTGGRTISDQDVQNILRALKMDSVFGQASTEVEILLAAKEMLIDIEKHARAIGSGGQRAYAALKLQELSMGRRGTKITANDVASYLEQPGGNQTAQDKKVVEMSDADKLKAVNAAQGKFAPTYTTLEEAIKDLGQSTVTRIISQ